MNSIQSNDNRLRGVNLGGWLVLEQWITPSLFEGTEAKDEYGFMQTPGAREKLERHRQTFITEADFEWIADHSLNAVRIPIGYWLLNGDRPYAPGIEYLDWAVEMADKYGLQVLVDLHGAKGSQNGNDHSGRAGQTGWYKSQTYREETVEVLKKLALRHRDAPALWGIELLNEPKFSPLTFLALRNFYRTAYRELQRIVRPGTHIVFSDAFAPRRLSGALKATPDYPVVMDVHWYQFGRTNLENYFATLERRGEEVEQLQQKQPVTIGEWSGMLSHLTLEGLPEADKAALQKRHIEMQLRAYREAAGWFYWTYKTEGVGIWNFRSLVERGELDMGVLE